MSIWLVYAGYLAAVNPARLRPALPDGNDSSRWFSIIGGAVLTLGVGIGLVAWSTNLLDALDITPETWRIAAGVIATVVGLRGLALPDRAAEPELGGKWAAVVPVAFPLLITPELVALISIFGATEPATRSLGGLALALAIGAATALVAHRRPGLWLAGARLFAAVLILVGLAMVVEGIRDV